MAALTASKSVTLDMYKSHARMKDGKVHKLDAQPAGTFAAQMDFVDGYMYTVQMMAGTNKTSGEPMNAGTFLVSTGDPFTYVYDQQCFSTGSCPSAPLYQPVNSSTYRQGTSTDHVSSSTGMRMKSHSAHDNLCLGSGSNETRLCLED